MSPFKQMILSACLVLSAGACASKPVVNCDEPPLTDEEVTKVADLFLQGQSMNDDFRRMAERRITPRGCNYEYEEAEKLDSFGVGIVVVVDRSRKVIDFYSSE